MNKTLLLLLFLPFQLSSQCEFTFDLGNDTSICEQDSLLLDASVPNGLYYLWQDGSESPLYYASTEGMHSCQAITHGPNIIENGDFESGDVLFTSEYIVGVDGPWGPLSDAGTYGIDSDPSLLHTNFSSCGDHTTGTGNMMVVNGATELNAVVWSQTIDVAENTNYQFSTWVISCVSNNPASLQFSINGGNLAIPFSPGATTCSWQQFAEVWNSGANTSATISIVNQNTLEGGNDFALDDIIFYELCTYTDSIYVELMPAPYVALGNDTIICYDKPLLLDASISGGSYLWQDLSTEATYLASETGLYWTIVEVSGCSNSDSIYVETDDCSVVLELPNVFSPNNDGVNDFFVPIIDIGVVSQQLRIYNRWGQLIFESTTANIKWDGEGYNEGSYFWIIDYIGIDREEYRKNGYLSLVR